MPLNDKHYLRSIPRRTDIPILALNGVDTIIKTGLMFDFTQDFKSKICFRHPADHVGYLFGMRDGAGATSRNFATYCYGNNLYAAVGSQAEAKFTATGFQSGDWWIHEVKRAAGQLSMSVYTAEGVHVETLGLTDGGNYDAIWPLVIGARHNDGAEVYSTFTAGEIGWASLEGAFHYPMEEQKDALVYNALTGGSAANATIETTATSITTVRAGRTDGIRQSHNDEFGYKLTNGVYIPGRVNIVPPVAVQA